MANPAHITRRAALKGIAVTAATAATAAAIAPAAAKALRVSADPNDTEVQLNALAVEFVAAAKLLDPTIKGAWIGRDHMMVDRDWALQSIHFERAHAPFFKPRVKT